MKNKKKTTIRIIAGTLKRQKIPVMNIKNLRPTTNKIRENLFNWLNKKIINANCLDCFSGTGALAIESISRGAQTVTVLEINKKIVYNITNVIKKLKISKIKIIHADTLKWLKKK